MGLSETQASRRQTAVATGLAVACWALLSVAYGWGLFHSFDLKLLDLRFHLRGERPAGDRIVLVGVDDATIRGYGAWPLPRAAYALLITALEEGGAKAVGVDLQFPNDRNQDPTSNQLLANVSARYDNLAHSIWFFARKNDAGASLSPSALDALARHGMLGEPGSLVAVAAGAAMPYDELAASARRFGHITVAVDPDGSIRRMPLLVRFSERTYAALALGMYGIERGWVGAPAFHSVRGGLSLHWPSGASITIPTDRNGATAIDYAGDVGSFPLNYSMLQVLQWYQAGDSARLRETFAGKTVLVGLTSREEASEDVGPTPFAAATPLLFVHANALDNLHRGRFLRSLPNVIYVGALALVAVGLGLAFARISLPLSAALALITTVALGASSQAALSFGSLDIPPFFPLALAPVTYAVVASHRFVFLQGRARRREQEIREGLTVQQQFLPEALIGKRFAHYRIEEKLGAGGMGTVYRARDERTGGEVAIKVLSGGVLADDKARRRFRHEALALARLRHPRIAGLIHSDSQDGFEFIVMEFVQGQSLAAHIRRGPLSRVEAVSIAAQIGDGLAEAHARGILHRDLKPHNVMIGLSGGVKLLDFGVARLANVGATMATVTGSMTESGHVVGTLPYLAPEILQGEPADERTDIYGLGVILFEMLTGQRPFREDNAHELIYMILNQPPPPPTLLRGSIGADLETLVLALLAKSPRERPQRVQDVLQRLRGMDLAA